MKPKITKDDLNAIGLFLTINQAGPAVLGIPTENCANFQEQKDWVLTSLSDFHVERVTLDAINELNTASDLLRFIINWWAKMN